MQTCLIIDESSVIRKVATRIIFQLDFTVANAASGADAMEILGQGELPDIIIVSGNLSDVPAETFVKSVRAMPQGAKPVVLACLVDANLGLMTRLKRAGCTGFIYKPFTRQSLGDWLTPYVNKAA